MVGCSISKICLYVTRWFKLWLWSIMVWIENQSFYHMFLWLYYHDIKWMMKRNSFTEDWKDWYLIYWILSNHWKRKMIIIRNMNLFINLYESDFHDYQSDFMKIFIYGILFWFLRIDRLDIINKCQRSETKRNEIVILYSEWI